MLDPVTKLGVKLRKEVVDAAYPPIIQSGGVYDLKVNQFFNQRFAATHTDTETWILELWSKVQGVGGSLEGCRPSVCSGSFAYIQLQHPAVTYSPRLGQTTTALP